MAMIANFAPARRPYIAAGLLTVLAVVGLTDAQVPHTPVPGTPATNTNAPTPIPSAAQPYVLFLVNASETMLETPAATTPQKGAMPKWHYALQALEQNLRSLPAGTGFHVTLYFDQTLESVGGRIAPDDHDAVARTLTRVRQAAPRGQANLEVALARANNPSRFPKPERLVLITDGLPTAGESPVTPADSPELARIQLFQSAVKSLRPRVPVHTILVPSSASDDAAAGQYWQLAHETRGGVRTQAKNPGDAPTHLAFVIDTSGSMRDPNNGKLWPSVIDAIAATLDANPQLVGVQLVDTDGRFILPRRSAESGGWQPATREIRETIDRTMRTYEQDTVSNPIPGIRNALRFLRDRASPTMRMSIYVLGDELNSSESASTALDSIAQFNPVDANGRRPVTINAIGFPTTVRSVGSMGKTGLRYASLMRQLTEEHGGAFVGLPEL